MTSHDSHLAASQDRHDRGFCDGCGEIPDVCTCAEDERPVGEVPPYLGRRGGVA